MKIRVSVNSKKPDTEIATDAVHAYQGLKGNPNFVNPPVPLDQFKTEIDTYAVKIAAAANNGGKQDIIDRNHQKATVVKMYRELGHWVEAVCKDDASIFQSSGFLAASNVRTPPQPLSTPVIAKAEHGKLSGQMSVKVIPIPKALSYVVRYTAIGADGKPGSWTELPPFPNSHPFVVTGLTPGTVYAFQVRALGKLGYTEWSDSANRMAV